MHLLSSLPPARSTSRCPRRKSFLPSGKILSTTGYLIGGQFPTQFNIILLSDEFPRLLLDICPPAGTARFLGNYIFSFKFLWSGALLSFQRQCDLTVLWPDDTAGVVRAKKYNLFGYVSSEGSKMFTEKRNPRSLGDPSPTPNMLRMLSSSNTDVIK